MAHIPQDARYVDPPTEREVDEDAVTEAAVEELQYVGHCPSCNTLAGVPVQEFAFAEWVSIHALNCDKLRERVLDRMGRDAE